MVWNDALLPLHFNWAVEYAVKRVQLHQDDLKLYDTQQRLVYADDVTIFGSSIHSVEKNTEALVVAGKEIWLQINADKTKYVVIYWDQIAEWNHGIKTDNKSLEKVEEFEYLWYMW